MAAPSILQIRGSDHQITGLMEDQRVEIGPSLRLLTDRHLPSGVRELRYAVSATTPYRDIGGLIFYAQNHGAKVKFEKAK